VTSGDVSGGVYILIMLQYVEATVAIFSECISSVLSWGMSALAYCVFV
jgi:hypothetical protein